jgi:hypothetical protein
VTKPALIPIEGSENMTRGGGGKWEPIKILDENLAYILKLTRHVSLLAQTRPHNYKEAIGPQYRVRQSAITAKDGTRCEQKHVRGYDNQNQTNKAIHYLSHISPNTLWVCSRNHHKSTMSTRKTQVF